MRKVMIFGTFDGVHEGHRALLAQAREHGDHITAVLARDETVQRLKERVPMHGEDLRRVHLLQEAHIDDVVLGVRSGDRYQIIRERKPHVIVLGYDQEHFIEELMEIITSEKIAIKVVRADAYEPERYKSSLLRDRSSYGMV